MDLSVYHVYNKVASVLGISVLCVDRTEYQAEGPKHVSRVISETQRGVEMRAGGRCLVSCVLGCFGFEGTF